MEPKTRVERLQQQAYTWWNARCRAFRDTVMKAKSAAEREGGDVIAAVGEAWRKREFLTLTGWDDVENMDNGLTFNVRRGTIARYAQMRLDNVDEHNPLPLNDACVLRFEEVFPDWGK